MQGLVGLGGHSNALLRSPFHKAHIQETMAAAWGWASRELHIGQTKVKRDGKMIRLHEAMRVSAHKTSQRRERAGSRSLKLFAFRPETGETIAGSPVTSVEISAPEQVKTVRDAIPRGTMKGR